jgi:hypothetical protein
MVGGDALPSVKLDYLHFIIKCYRIEKNTRRIMMPVYKLKGKIDKFGNLIIKEPIQMPPGEVEVHLQSLESADISASKTEMNPAKTHRQVECSVPTLKEWLELTEPAPSDFDDDQAKWDYLKEKYNL